MKRLLLFALVFCLALLPVSACAEGKAGAASVADTITFAALIRASYQSDTYSGGEEAFYDMGLLPANDAPDENGQLVYYTYPKDYKVVFDTADEGESVTAVTVKRKLEGSDSYETYVKAYNLLAGLATPFITSEDTTEDFANAFGGRWIAATGGKDEESYAGDVRFQGCDVSLFRDDAGEADDAAEVGFVITYPTPLTEENVKSDAVFAQLIQRGPK